MMRKLLLIILIALFMGACVSNRKSEPLNILVFSKTIGYRHDCIPAGLAALEKLRAENDWQMLATEDSLLFTPETLDTIDVVVFLQTIGDIFDDSQQEALKSFVMNGGGLVTIHTGTITENGWPWFVDAVGGIFVGHPPTQKGTLIIEDRNHPATAFFPDTTWIIEDEWYSFDRNPRKDVQVLISVDESTYDVDDNKWFDGAVQRMGDHPLVWHKTVGEGRVFQTALGHTPEHYSNTLFIQHIGGAIKWAGDH